MIRVAGWSGADGRWRVVAIPARLQSCGPDLAPARLVVERWPAPPALAGHKVLRRRQWDLARESALAQGADDALLVDATGRVMETSVANVWVRRHDTLLTPPAPAACLPGVMRRWVLEAAARLDVRATECDVRVDDVAAARRTLLAAGATPVGEITVTPDGDELAMLRDPWGFAVQLARRGTPMA